MDFLNCFWKRLTVKSIGSWVSIILWACWCSSVLLTEHSRSFLFVFFFGFSSVSWFWCFLSLWCCLSVVLLSMKGMMICHQAFLLFSRTQCLVSLVHICRYDWSIRFLCCPGEINIYRALWKFMPIKKSFNAKNQNKIKQKQARTSNNVKGTNSLCASF